MPYSKVLPSSIPISLVLMPIASYSYSYLLHTLSSSLLTSLAYTIIRVAQAFHYLCQSLLCFILIPFVNFIILIANLYYSYYSFFLSLLLISVNVIPGSTAIVPISLIITSNLSNPYFCRYHPYSCALLSLFLHSVLLYRALSLIYFFTHLSLLLFSIIIIHYSFRPYC